MKYCVRCLYPDTKPYIQFNSEGVCNACIHSDIKKSHLEEIDWEQRELEFERIVMAAKSKKAPFYDALVPVSGGKDSITQVSRLLKFDLKILAVNVDYGIKTEIGRQNLECIPKMGTNLMIYRPELNLHKQLVRIGFEDFGDPDLLSHTLLHGYPLHVALQLNIPLVLLGENSAAEYGGDKDISKLTTITREWFSKYAANKGHDARFVSTKYNISFDKLVLYDFPDRLNESDIQTLFCSSYFYWDSEKHLEIAKRYGFQTLDHPREGTYRTYVGIDEKINRIHQYMKVLKFGYGRATDHACEDIRNGRFSREEAKAVVKEQDLKPLSDYFIDDFVEFIGISKSEFFEIMERFRNKDIWEKDAAGTWIIPGHLED